MSNVVTPASIVGGVVFGRSSGGGGGGGATLNFPGYARVELSENGGSDGTGTVGDPSKPYETIQAAVDDLLASGAAAYRLEIGPGEFVAPDDTTQLTGNWHIFGVGVIVESAFWLCSAVAGGRFIFSPSLTLSAIFIPRGTAPRTITIEGARCESTMGHVAQAQAKINSTPQADDVEIRDCRASAFEFVCNSGNTFKAFDCATTVVTGYGYFSVAGEDGGGTSLFGEDMGTAYVLNCAAGTFSFRGGNGTDEGDGGDGGSLWVSQCASLAGVMSEFYPYGGTGGFEGAPGANGTLINQSGGTSNEYATV